MALRALIESVRARTDVALKRADFFAPLLARVTLGVLFVSTGWAKINNLDKVTSFFAELGIPAPQLQAPFVSAVELVGGALLLVGLGSRLAAIPLVASMAVAIVTAKREEVSNLPDLFGLVEWTYLAMLVWVALTGPGRASLDHLLFGRARQAEAELPSIPRGRSLSEPSTSHSV